MTERLFTSPREITIPLTIPLVFLAGPVQGAPDWQSLMAQEIFDARPDVAVASPRRRPEDETSFNPEEQVLWEHESLLRARRFGTIGIWWAAQDLSDASYRQGRAYAQTTRIEEGMTFGWHEFRPGFVPVIGFDSEYGPNGGGSESYSRIMANILNIPVHDSIDDFTNALMKSIPPKRQTYPQFSHRDVA